MTAKPAAAVDDETGAAVAAPAAADAPAAGGDAPENPLLRRREYTFAAADIDGRVAAALSKRGRTAKIKGFRPGKAPVSVLRRMFGQEALNEVLAERAGKEFETEMKAGDERAAAMPRFELAATAAGGADYRVLCIYEAMPAVAAADFAGKTVKKPALPVGDGEVDEMIEILRARAGKYIETAAPAVAGSRVRADFKIWRIEDADDQPFDEGGDRLLIVGAPGAPAEMNAALTGAVAGDNKTVPLTFDDNHPDEALRGKTATMKLQVKAVEALEKPPLDDAFFARMGAPAGEGLAGFRRMVEEHLRREVGFRLRNLLQRRALDALINATPAFPLPQVLVYHEAATMLQAARAHWQQQGAKQIADSLRLENFAADARRRVALGLILSAWQKRHNPKIDDAAIEARLDEAAAAYEDPPQMKAQIRADAQRMEGVRLSVLEDIVTEWVCAQAGAEEETLTLTQALGSDAGGGAPVI